MRIGDGAVNGDAALADSAGQPSDTMVAALPCQSAKIVLGDLHALCHLSLRSVTLRYASSQELFLRNATFL